MQQVVKIFFAFSGIYASGQINELKKWTLRESVQLVFIPASIYTVGKRDLYLFLHMLTFTLLYQPSNSQTKYQFAYFHTHTHTRSQAQNMLCQTAVRSSSPSVMPFSLPCSDLLVNKLYGSN